MNLELRCWQLPGLVIKGLLRSFGARARYTLVRLTENLLPKESEYTHVNAKFGRTVVGPGPRVA